MTPPYFAAPKAAAAAAMMLVLHHHLTLPHAYTPPQHFTTYRKSAHPLTAIFLSSPDGVAIDNENNNIDSSAEEIANQLRERALNLRREAKSAEQSLRSATERKKEVANVETDEWIDSLLGLTTSAVVATSEDTER
eukprot:scaffold42886_cov153-Skeletonema_marinoi.AAC.2